MNSDEATYIGDPLEDRIIQKGSSSDPLSREQLLHRSALIIKYGLGPTRVLELFPCLARPNLVHDLFMISRFKSKMYAIIQH